MKRSLALVFAFFATFSLMVIQPEPEKAEASGGFTSLSRPVRMLDTRPSGDKVGGYDTSRQPYRLVVTGRDSIPAGTTAIAMNLTVTGTEANDFGGFATVYPCGGSVPTASNLNFVTGQTVANSVISPVASNGEVCIDIYGKAHVLVDVSGYFTSGFESLDQPVRFLDTRPTGDKVGGYEPGRTPYSLAVGGVNGVPAGVTAVAMNLTVTGTEANDFGGYATVYPCGGSVPTASNLNFTTGMTVANSVIAPVSSAGTICIDVYGKAHVLVDISGYFSSGFTSLSQPVRFLDTRPMSAPVGNYDLNSIGSYVLGVTGRDGVPAGATAVAMNLTVTSTQANDYGGYATVYPCGARPDASNLNFVSGQTVANSVVAPLSSAGQLCIDVYGLAHVLVDISGYLSADSSGGGGSSNVGTNALTFDLAGAAGVALVDEPVTRTVYRRDGRGKVQAFETSSNLLAVDESGGTRAATASGVADISRLLVAPDNKVYVLFDQRVNLSDTSLQCWPEWSSSGTPTMTGRWTAQVEIPVTSEWGTYTEYRQVECAPPCLLGQINPATGLVECIDNDLQSIWWNDWDSTSNSAIQFDDNGNIYYHGNDESGRGILRRYTNGVTTDLVNDNVRIDDYLVTGSGKIYITGTTNTTNDQWFRELSPVDGQVRPATEQILRGYVEWMTEFPDGRVYYSSSNNWANINAWDPATKASSTWLLDYDPNDTGPGSWSAACQEIPRRDLDTDGDGYNDTQEYGYTLCDFDQLSDRNPLAIPGCYTETPLTTQRFNWTSSQTVTVAIPGEVSRSTTNDFFCSQPGRLRLPLHRTIQGAVYGIAGEQWGSSSTTSVARYYPTPEVFTSSVVRATVALPILDYMLISGSDANEDYITTLFDLGEGTEIPIIGRGISGSNEEIEIYRMSVGSGNRVLFDGQRFSDSSYVIGSIDLSTGRYVASETGEQRLLDFQAFQ